MKGPLSVMSNAIASALWSTVNAGMRALVRLRILRGARLPVRVISLGNLQVGGSGKTPLVALIAREGAERGRVVAILCRGYGGIWEEGGGMLIPGEPPPSTELCGDEARLLHDLAPQAYIGVGADRVAQYRKLDAEIRKREGRPADLVILDDGFQHWRIQKDLEILAVTSRTRFQVVYRDWGAAAREADLIVWTKGERMPREVRRAGEPVVRVRMYIPKFEAEAPVCLVTGLGDPEESRKSLEQAGFRVARHLRCPDHARYEADWVRKVLGEAAQRGERVVVTGKDWVKWRELGVRSTEIQVVEPEIEFLSGRERWSQVLWESA